MINYKQQQIADFSSSRCDDYSSDISRFISSSLSRSKKFITLDKILITAPDGSTSLITNAAMIKKATIDHYQNFVPIPKLPASSFQLDKLPLHWQHRYTPIDSIMDNIYEELMIPISLDEWTATLTSMPKDKAAGPSKITYEMIQHLGPVAMSEMLDLMNK